MPNHIHNVIFHIDNPKVILTGHNVDYNKVIPQPIDIFGVPSIWGGVIPKYKERLTSELKFKLVVGFPSSELIKQKLREFKSLQDFKDWATIISKKLIEVGKLPKDFSSMYYDKIHNTTCNTAFDYIVTCMYCKYIYGFEHELDWNLAHWSTKWNAYCPVHNIYEYTDKMYKTVGFRSAWSPPFLVYTELARRTNFLAFTTDEVLGSECYILLGQNGNLLKWNVSSTDIGYIVSTALEYTHENSADIEDYHVQSLLYTESLDCITDLDKLFVQQEAKNKFKVILDEFERVLAMKQDYNSAKESILSKHLIIGG